VWAAVSHLLVYKPGQPPPPEVQRRIYRLMALIELFDKEVTDARSTLMALPGFVEGQILQQLEQQFYRLTARDFDRELSLDIIGKLQGSYAHGELDTFGEHMADFVSTYAEKLNEIFARYRDDLRCSPLLFQPESLLILRALHRNL